MDHKLKPRRIKKNPPTKPFLGQSGNDYDLGLDNFFESPSKSLKAVKKTNSLAQKTNASECKNSEYQDEPKNSRKLSSIEKERKLKTDSEENKSSEIVLLENKDDFSKEKKKSNGKENMNKQKEEEKSDSNMTLAMNKEKISLIENLKATISNKSATDVRIGLEKSKGDEFKPKLNKNQVKFVEQSQIINKKCQLKSFKEKLEEEKLKVSSELSRSRTSPTLFRPEQINLSNLKDIKSGKIPITSGLSSHYNLLNEMKAVKLSLKSTESRVKISKSHSRATFTDTDK